MPAKPTWIGRIDQLERATNGKSQLRSSIIKDILRVSSRRAQQLISELPGDVVGRSLLVDRDALLYRLRSIAAGTENAFEVDRRARFAAKLAAMRRERLSRPQLLVESPVSVVNTRIDQLPEGVAIEPGRITVSCDSAEQACQRLLALAMAIGNDPGKFSQLVEAA